MKATHLLDTSVYSQPLRRHPLPEVIDRWSMLGEDALSISALCEAELLQGLEHSGSTRLWELYRRLLHQRFPILDFTSSVASTYGTLAGVLFRAGRPRPVLDLLIAATAKHHGLIIATLNVKDFSGIPGVAVEDWSR